MASWALRGAIFVAPMVAALAASLWVSTQLPRSETALGVTAWWGTLIVVSGVVAWAVDRVARQLLPLTLMLRMTMLFPDRAPPRFRVALRSSNISELRKRVAAADIEGTTDLSAAAELILSLASALNSHDRRTRGHGERTRAYADILAEELRVPMEGRDKLRWAALLHDIGKLEVPAEIINKDGPLDTEEMDVMRRHPLMGMTVAAPIVPWLGEWAGAIEHHHEWWDGTGYPRGLSGTDISFAARIVAVADAFDVMTSGRSYQAAKSPVTARREVTRMAGTQFDPAVARALMNVSLGKLRWALGPMAWIGHIPFFLDRMGRDFVTVLSAATVTAAAVVGGVIPTSVPVSNPPVMSAESSGATDQELPGGHGIIAAEDSSSSSSSGFSGGFDPQAELGPSPEPSPTAPTSTPPSSTPPPPTTPTTTTPTTTTLGPAPMAHPDVASTPRDTSVTIRVLDNDVPAGLTLNAITSQPSSGTATVSGATIVYTPDPGTHGSDTLGYRACDSYSRCSDSTVAIRVTRVNQPPTARDDSATTDRNVAATIDVLANDSDPDGDTLAIASVTQPRSGTAAHTATGVTYTPSPEFVGNDSFTYRVCDPENACDTATVTLTVRAVDRPPNAVDDAATYNPGGQGSVDVLANDTHPDGVALDRGSLEVITRPSHGEIKSISGGVIKFAINVVYTGSDSFVYRVCAANGLCDTATVTLTRRA
ncbi:hypothetical protein BH23ACT5_BH23ACT5_05720 [soil metagenome]